jgi:hypothetical protein
MERLSLRVPVFGEREAECGNTSLKSVSWFQGRRYTARYLGRMAHLTKEESTTPTWFAPRGRPVPR